MAEYKIISSKGKGIGTGQVAKENDERLANDAQFRASEIERANQVIADRKAAGADISQQEIYLKKIQQFEDAAAPPPVVTSGVDTLGSQAQNIQNIYANMKKAQSAEVDSAVSQAVSGYESQIGSTAQEAQELRNKQDVTTARQQQSQREVAAAKGLAYSGGAASDQIGTEAAGQQAKTAYTVQEQNAISALKRAIQDTIRTGELQKVTLGANLGAQEATALLNQQNQNRQFEMQEAGLTGTYKGQDTLASTQMKQQQEQWNKSFQESIRQADLSNGQWWAGFNADRERDNWNKRMDIAELDMRRAEMEWGMSPSNPSNMAKTVSDELGFTGAASQLVDHIYSNLIPAQIKNLNQYDESQTEQFYDDLNQQIYASIMAWPGVSDEDKDRLLAATINMND